jgi:hypothetical protein
LDIYKNYKIQSNPIPLKNSSQENISYEIKKIQKKNLNLNSFQMIRKSKTGKFFSDKNLLELQHSKNSDLDFNLMKSILGHINSTNTNEENCIEAVPVYVISMTKDDDKIITGDNNG